MVEQSCRARTCEGSILFGAVRYDAGRGVAKDETKAFEWWSKAAAQGHADAQCNLGDCYFHGRGVAKDEKKAAEWYRKAAVGGDLRAQRWLEKEESAQKLRKKISLPNPFKK